jgi:Fe-S oxidoreductase
LDEEMKDIIEETSKCLYCGFCEAVCPTLPYGPHRGYDPRGRVYLAREMALTGRGSGEALSSIFSCLTCGACTLKCPTRISVADLVKKVRGLVLSGKIESDLGKIIIRSR